MVTQTTEVPTIYICGASRGRYGYPWRIDGSRGIRRWRDAETDKMLRRPKMVSCESSRHWDPDDGRRRRYSREKCYVQRWTLTRKELRETVDAYDVFSLTMPVRLLCPDCAREERRKLKAARLGGLGH